MISRRSRGCGGSQIQACQDPTQSKEIVCSRHAFEPFLLSSLRLTLVTKNGWRDWPKTLMATILCWDEQEHRQCAHSAALLVHVQRVLKHGINRPLRNCFQTSRLGCRQWEGGTSQRRYNPHCTVCWKQQNATTVSKSRTDWKCCKASQSSSAFSPCCFCNPLAKLKIKPMILISTTTTVLLLHKKVHQLWNRAALSTSLPSCEPNWMPAAHGLCRHLGRYRRPRARQAKPARCLSIKQILIHPIPHLVKMIRRLWTIWPFKKTRGRLYSLRKLVITPLQPCRCWGCTTLPKRIGLRLKRIG